MLLALFFELNPMEVFSFLYKKGAGGQVDQGQGGLHHVGGGVVQTIRYICVKLFS